MHVLCLPAPAGVTRLLNGELANAAEPGAPVDRSETLEPGKAASLRQALFPEMRFPELLPTTHRRNAKRYGAALLSVDEAQLSAWGHVIRKPPGGRSATWHQDHVYWPAYDS